VKSGSADCEECHVCCCCRCRDASHHGAQCPDDQTPGRRKVYRTDRIETVALTGIDLSVREGELVSIMGPSGCGKSTLLNIIRLLDVPTGGRVEINGSAVSASGDRALAAIRNKELGFVFQTFHLIPDLAVVDNVEIRCCIGGSRTASAVSWRRRRWIASGCPRGRGTFRRSSRAASGSVWHRAGDRRTSENPPRRRADRQPRQPDGR
jgi:hypothetical protein